MLPPDGTDPTGQGEGNGAPMVWNVPQLVCKLPLGGIREAGVGPKDRSTLFEGSTAGLPRGLYSQRTIMKVAKHRAACAHCRKVNEGRAEEGRAEFEHAQSKRYLQPIRIPGSAEDIVHNMIWALPHEISTEERGEWLDVAIKELHSSSGLKEWLLDLEKVKDQRREREVRRQLQDRLQQRRQQQQQQEEGQLENQQQSPSDAAGPTSSESIKGRQESCVSGVHPNRKVQLQPLRYRPVDYMDTTLPSDVYQWQMAHEHRELKMMESKLSIEELEQSGKFPTREETREANTFLAASKRKQEQVIVGVQEGRNDSSFDTATTSRNDNDHEGDILIQNTPKVTDPDQFWYLPQPWEQDLEHEDLYGTYLYVNRQLTQPSPVVRHRCLLRYLTAIKPMEEAFMQGQLDKAIQKSLQEVWCSSFRDYMDQKCAEAEGHLKRFEDRRIYDPPVHRLLQKMVRDARSYKAAILLPGLKGSYYQPNPMEISPGDVQVALHRLKELADRRKEEEKNQRLNQEECQDGNITSREVGTPLQPSPTPGSTWRDPREAHMKNAPMGRRAGKMAIGHHSNQMQQVRQAGAGEPLTANSSNTKQHKLQVAGEDENNTEYLSPKLPVKGKPARGTRLAKQLEHSGNNETAAILPEGDDEGKESSLKSFRYQRNVNLKHVAELLFRFYQAEYSNGYNYFIKHGINRRPLLMTPPTKGNVDHFVSIKMFAPALYKKLRQGTPPKESAKVDFKFPAYTEPNMVDALSCLPDTQSREKRYQEKLDVCNRGLCHGHGCLGLCKIQHATPSDIDEPQRNPDSPDFGKRGLFRGLECLEPLTIPELMQKKYGDLLPITTISNHQHLTISLPCIGHTWKLSYGSRGFSEFLRKTAPKPAIRIEEEPRKKKIAVVRYHPPTKLQVETRDEKHQRLVKTFFNGVMTCNHKHPIPGRPLPVLDENRHLIPAQRLYRLFEMAYQSVPDPIVSGQSFPGVKLDQDAVDYMRKRKRELGRLNTTLIDEETRRRLQDIHQDTVHVRYAKLLEEALEKAFAKEHGASRHYAITSNYEGMMVRASGATTAVQHGLGKMVMEDGSLYCGDFRMGKPHGVGTWIAGDGSWVYGGDVNQGCRTGRGSLCFFTHGVERATFVGSFKNGEPHGKCLHHDYAGNFYTGTWKDGKPEGGASIHRPDGWVYQGPMHSGAEHGDGKLLSPNGDLYVGEFHKGAITGQGKVIIKSTQVTYQGAFKDGLFHGEGVLKVPNGIKYEGYFHEGVAQDVPTKLRCLPERYHDIRQGDTIALRVACVDEQGQVMKTESGRRIMITCLKRVPDNRALPPSTTISGEMRKVKKTTTTSRSIRNPDEAKKLKNLSRMEDLSTQAIERQLASLLKVMTDDDLDEKMSYPNYGWDKREGACLFTPFGFFGTPYRVIKYAPKTAQPCQPSKVSPSSNMKCSSHLQTAMYRQTPVTFEINSKQVADQSMRSIYSEISKHIPTRVSTYLNYVLSSGKLADSHRKADAFHASQDPMVFFEDTREKDPLEALQVSFLATQVPSHMTVTRGNPIDDWSQVQSVIISEASRISAAPTYPGKLSKDGVCDFVNVFLPAKRSGEFRDISPTKHHVPWMLDKQKADKPHNDDRLKPTDLDWLSKQPSILDALLDVKGYDELVKRYPHRIGGLERLVEDVDTSKVKPPVGGKSFSATQVWLIRYKCAMRERYSAESVRQSTTSAAAAAAGQKTKPTTVKRSDVKLEIKTEFTQPTVPTVSFFPPLQQSCLDGSYPGAPQIGNYARFRGADHSTKVSVATHLSLAMKRSLNSFVAMEDFAPPKMLTPMQHDRNLARLRKKYFRDEAKIDREATAVANLVTEGVENTNAPSTSSSTVPVQTPPPMPCEELRRRPLPAPENTAEEVGELPYEPDKNRLPADMVAVASSFSNGSPSNTSSQATGDQPNGLLLDSSNAEVASTSELIGIKPESTLYRRLAADDASVDRVMIELAMARDKVLCKPSLYKVMKRFEERDHTADPMHAGQSRGILTDSKLYGSRDSQKDSASAEKAGNEDTSVTLCNEWQIRRRTVCPHPEYWLAPETHQNMIRYRQTPLPGNILRHINLLEGYYFRLAESQSKRADYLGGNYWEYFDEMRKHFHRDVIFLRHRYWTGGEMLTVSELVQVEQLIHAAEREAISKLRLRALREMEIRREQVKVQAKATNATSTLPIAVGSSECKPKLDVDPAFLKDSEVVAQRLCQRVNEIFESASTADYPHNSLPYEWMADSYKPPPGLDKPRTPERASRGRSVKMHVAAEKPPHKQLAIVKPAHASPEHGNTCLTHPLLSTLNPRSQARFLGKAKDGCKAVCKGKPDKLGSLPSAAAAGSFPERRPRFLLEEKKSKSLPEKMLLAKLSASGKTPLAAARQFSADSSSTSSSVSLPRIKSGSSCSLIETKPPPAQRVKMTVAPSPLVKESQPQNATTGPYFNLAGTPGSQVQTDSRSSESAELLGSSGTSAGASQSSPNAPPRGAQHSCQQAPAVPHGSVMLSPHAMYPCPPLPAVGEKMKTARKKEEESKDTCALKNVEILACEPGQYVIFAHDITPDNALPYGSRLSPDCLLITVSKLDLTAAEEELKRPTG